MGGQLNLRFYALGSIALAAIVIANAYHVRKQFYMTCIHLATSKASMMALGNIALLLFLLFGQLVKKIFFGTLRDVEVEHLTEKLWSTVMDTLLVMTVFREDFNTRFIAYFVVLLFVKAFHWVSQDRVDYIQQTPEVSFVTHFRIVAMCSILLFFDIFYVFYAVTYTMKFARPTMMVLFGFEYLLLTFTALSIIGKYVLNVIDIQQQGRWEGKGAYVLYLDFIIDMFKLMVYIAFFGIILMYYGIPLHIIRQLWGTFVSFRRRIIEVIRYRKAVVNMETRFPNATPEELRNAHQCIVCREEMAEGKKLPCGHILHKNCLRSWLEQQQVCPICRTSVLQEDVPRRPNAQQNQFNQNPAVNFHQANPAANFGQANPAMNFQQANRQNQPGADVYPGNWRPTEPVGTTTFVDVAQQIKMLQDQIALIHNQLGVLAAQLEAQKHSEGSAAAPLAFNASQTMTPESTTDDLMKEEELLQQALNESARMADEELQSSRDGKDEVVESTKKEEVKQENATELTTSQEDPSPSPKSDEQDEIRRRRLLRFSQS